MAEASVWQREEAGCATVLGEVFQWLEARALARCGAACRAWRRAATAPALWRRALLRAGADSRQLAALRDQGVCWRDEAVSALAGWWKVARLAAPAPLLHAALAPPEQEGALTLALAADDGSLTVWVCDEAAGCGAWHCAWRADMRALGWASVARAEWAPGGGARRLLLAGPLALVDHWELLVLELRDEGRWKVASRARCSAGAAGCWAGAADAFLSLELSPLAPALAFTTVWLNAATQETQSEYAGVRTPLLRIYNGNGEHITHALVEVAALDERDGSRRWLVAGGGRRLCSWALRAARPAPLVALAAGELAARVALRRERAARAESPPREPDEAAVRALCEAPRFDAPLPAPLVGLAPHPREARVWAALSSGAAECFELPTLAALARVRAPEPPLAPPVPHYVQPAVSHRFVASPEGAWSATVRVWSGRSCAAPTRLPHGAPCVAALLPRALPASLLVAAGDHLHVWRSRATPQFGWRADKVVE